MLAATVQNSWRQYLVPDSEFFGIGEKLIERGAIQQSAAQDEGANFMRVADVVKRISVEQEQVGIFADSYSPLRIQLAEKLGRVSRRRLQRFHRRQPTSTRQEIQEIQQEINLRSCLL